MSAGSWTRTHRRSILFLLLLLAIGGTLAAFRLPVSLFPTIDFPRVVVSLDAGDQPVEQMEMLVTRQVEEAVREVPGVRKVRSTTSRGSAEVSVNFDWGRDMATSALQVNAAIARIMPSLPPGTRQETRRMDPTVFPILAYSLVSGSLSPTELRDLAEYQVRPMLSAVNGISHILVQGGAQEEIRVTVDPSRLRAADLALDDVTRALAGANIVSVVGRIEDHYKLFLVTSNARIAEAAQLRALTVRNSGGALIRLGDVASVEQSVLPEWTRVTADGRDAVLLSIYQQPGSDSVQIARDVKARLEVYKARLPQGVAVARWYDQAELVVQSAASVRDAILIGTALSACVLLFFLRNLKVTLIAVVVVPAVLATTVLLLHVLGMSFNIMTLGGMAAAVGLVIDDAIVMIEHIMRRLHEDTSDLHQRVREAAREFLRPLAGSSASTLVIFVPLAFLDGVAGAFFKALSLTMASALLISFLVTWLAVPLIADHFLDARDAAPHPPSKLLTRLHGWYARLLARLLARPALLALGLLPLLLMGALAFTRIGSGFMPEMDEGGFVLDYRSAPGTALSETDRLLRQVEQIIRATPDVASYSRRTGNALGGGLTEASEGDFFIRLKASGRRPADEVMDEVRSKVEHAVPGLHIELAQLMEDLIGDLTTVPQPVEIKLFGDQPELLAAAANALAARIGKITGVVDVKNGINPAGDALEIHIDPARAALEGMDADAITRALDGILEGTVATRLARGVKMVGVRVWTPKSMRATDSDLGKLELRAPDGHLFPLRRVATVSTLSGQAQVTRENLKRMVAVTARIAGRDLGSVIADVRRALAQPGALPADIEAELGGLYEQQQIAFRGLVVVFASASALVFLLLLFMYESFRIALAIVASALMAASAVFIGLWICQIDLNISAMMGMTMIVGMAAEVAIFYFSEQQSLDPAGSDPQALVDAGLNRMRPIAMTTLAAILTLLPLAFALGQGSEMQQPLAVAIISGLLVQLPLVLLAMPVLYHLMRKRHVRPPESSHPLEN
ncbi:MAG: efflux RND transporter permease subunit [Pseudomonadota bacterium]